MRSEAIGENPDLSAVGFPRSLEYVDLEVFFVFWGGGLIFFPRQGYPGLLWFFGRWFVMSIVPCAFYHRKYVPRMYVCDCTFPPIAIAPFLFVRGEGRGRGKRVKRARAAWRNQVHDFFFFFFSPKSWKY